MSLTQLTRKETNPPLAQLSAAIRIPDKNLAFAHFGGGCFWCLEAAFEQFGGVGDVESGYAGGRIENPTYAQVSSGHTGHAEVVRVPYDRTVVAYRELLDIFFAIHDPTTKDAQGPDHGSQYRSIILVQTEEEKERAHRHIRAIAPDWERPIVTEIVSLERFWVAESEHQNFFARNPNIPYCQSVVAPKVTKVRAKYGNKLKGASKN